MKKRLTISDFTIWQQVYSEWMRVRFEVVEIKDNKVLLKDITKYAEWQYTARYATHEIDDNFFH